MGEHRRDYDDAEYQHQRESDSIPNWLRWSFVAINRVGFPIVVFFFMWYDKTTSQKRLAEALERQSNSLNALVIKMDTNHSEAQEWRNRIDEQMRDIRMRLK